LCLGTRLFGLIRRYRSPPRSAAPWKREFGAPGPARNMFDRGRGLGTPRRGCGGAQAYQLCVIMWRFSHKRTSHRPCPTGYMHKWLRGARTRRPPTQPDSALKSHSQEWNFGDSRTSGARIPREGGGGETHRLRHQPESLGQ
jgi:hypothetical protein